MISVGWRVKVRRAGVSPTKGSTMDKRCKQSFCSSGVNLNEKPPMRDGSYSDEGDETIIKANENSSLRTLATSFLSVLIATNGSVLS